MQELCKLIETKIERGVWPCEEEKMKKGRLNIMKRSILALAVLMLATPALAEVILTATDEGGCIVAINYDATGEPNLVRAFALDVSVTDGTITGVDTTGAQPYNIYPGTIDINSTTGVVDYVGTPVAPAGAPDSPGQLGSSAIVLETGSLYEKGVGTPPTASGLLIKIQVNPGESCELCVSPNALRGGVVLEDPDLPVDVNETGACTLVEPCGCFPSCHDDYETWLAMGELHGMPEGEGPECWCYLRQCHGDTDDAVEGSIITGYTYVGIPDLDLMSLAWGVLEPSATPPFPPDGPGIVSIPNGICADFAHDLEGSIVTGYTRVGITDLNAMSLYWGVLEPSATPPFPPDGPGTPPDCLDCP